MYTLVHEDRIFPVFIVIVALSGGKLSAKNIKARGNPSFSIQIAQITLSESEHFLRKQRVVSVWKEWFNPSFWGYNERKVEMDRARSADGGWHIAKYCPFRPTV